MISKCTTIKEIWFVLYLTNMCTLLTHFSSIVSTFIVKCETRWQANVANINDDFCSLFILPSIRYVAFFTNISLFSRIINPFREVRGIRENMIEMSAVSISRSRSTLCWQEIKLLYIATVIFSVVIIVPKLTTMEGILSNYASNF